MSDEVAGSAASTEGSRPKDRDRSLVHTVTACTRCRSRKTRCDPTLERCLPCERANAPCEYFDSVRNATISRSYITSLQDTVRRLHAELQAIESEQPQHVDQEAMARAAGLVKFNENDDPRFLGPSSGSAITRFVMEFAKQNTARKTIRDVVPDSQTQEMKQKFDAESAKPTSKVYALTASVPATNLTLHHLMEKLIEIYMVKAQYMLPLLHEPTFRRDVELVYNGSNDPTLNFQVRLVTAISMQKVDKQYAGLADSYYLAALPYLSEAIQRRDLSTLQCFALIAQYSLVTPTRTAAYWVVGLAAKLCQELGLCSEQTIEKSPTGTALNKLEIDMRRRMYWIIMSMEYGLSHCLGRPSAFGVSVDNINVRFFEMCDDQYITPEGLLPGHHPIMKKCIAIHFLKMRLLQAEIRRTLYLKKRSSPLSESDPWFQMMLNKIDNWIRGCPKNDEGSGLSESWFQGRRYTMIIMMYRPTPQIPIPTVHAAQLCFEAATFLGHLQEEQVRKASIDITWIFTQAVFMALNTILWSISHAELRQLHSIEEVTGHIEVILRAIDLCADRWPGVISARQLYNNLIHGCLRAYENDRSVRSPGSVSMNDYSSPASLNAQSPGSTTATSLYGPQSPSSMAGTQQYPLSVQKPPMMSQRSHESQHSISQSVSPLVTTSMMAPGKASSIVSSPSTTMNVSPSFHSVAMDGQMNHYPFPNYQQQLPSWEMVTSAPSVTPHSFAFASSMAESQPWLASFADVYSEFIGPAGSGQVNYPMQLGEQDQIDLMASLENSQLPDISGLVNNANTYYVPQFPDEVIFTM